MFTVRSIPSVVTWQKMNFARRVARILQTSNTDNVLVGEFDVSLFVRLWNRSKEILNVYVIRLEDMGWIQLTFVALF
jgi:hypothetical protein